MSAMASVQFEQTPEGALSLCIALYSEAATTKFLQSSYSYVELMEEKVADKLWASFYPSFKAAFDSSTAHWKIEKSDVMAKAKLMGQKSAEKAMAAQAKIILWNQHAEPAVHEVVTDSKNVLGDTRWCS